MHSWVQLCGSWGLGGRGSIVCKRPLTDWGLGLFPFLCLLSSFDSSCSFEYSGSAFCFLVYINKQTNKTSSCRTEVVIWHISRSWSWEGIGLVWQDFKEGFALPHSSVLHTSRSKGVKCLVTLRAQSGSRVWRVMLMLSLPSLFLFCQAVRVDNLRSLTDESPWIRFCQINSHFKPYHSYRSLL